jgi:hypothetical protein
MDLASIQQKVGRTKRSVAFSIKVIGAFCLASAMSQPICTMVATAIQLKLEQQAKVYRYPEVTNTFL